MLMLLAFCVTFLLTSSMLAVLGATVGGGLFVMLGRAGMAVRALIVDRAAFIVATAAFIAMLGMLAMPMGRFICCPSRDKAKDVETVDWRGSWSTDLGLRLSGIGIPALAHIAAAFALAISSSWSLSSSVRRGGVLLELRRGREVDLLLRRIRTGEWLGVRFHLSRRSSGKPLLLRRELDCDLLDRERRALDRDLLLLAGERDFERLLLSADLDLLLRAGDRDFDRFFLVGDLDLDRFLLGDLDCECLALILDLERNLRFLPADFDLDRLFLEGDFDLDFFLRLRDGDLDFLFLVGDFDLDFFRVVDFVLDCFFCEIEVDLERFWLEGDLELDLLFLEGLLDFECFFCVGDFEGCLCFDDLCFLLCKGDLQFFVAGGFSSVNGEYDFEHSPSSLTGDLDLELPQSCGVTISTSVFFSIKALSSDSSGADLSKDGMGSHNLSFCGETDLGLHSVSLFPSSDTTSELCFG